MNRRRRARPAAIVEPVDASVLDLVDQLLNKGVVVSGEVMLGLAGIDLIYLRLAVLFCAADLVLPRTDGASRPRRSTRRSVR